MKKSIFSFAALTATIVVLLTGCTQKERLLTGGFSATGEAGMNLFEFNTSSGEMILITEFNAGPNPAYFCFSATRDLIYAINEVSEFNGVQAGGITTISHDGKLNNLKKISEMPVPTGGPCYIAVDPLDKYLLIANYGGGSVAVVRLDGNGVPSEVTQTIVYDTIGGKKSHAHMIDFDPMGKRVYVSDLGLDRVMIYTLDYEAGILLPLSESRVAVPAGTGPRHFVFNSSGSMLYLMGELNNTVTVFQVNNSGGLTEIQTIQSRDGSSGIRNYSADIHLGRDGKYLYTTNRGDNTVVTFTVRNDGKLSDPVSVSCGGDWPRNFTVDPSGKFIIVGNQKSDQISVLKIDSETGLPAIKVSEHKVPAPACHRFITY
jgi:6-phosphogluconolactonase